MFFLQWVYSYFYYLCPRGAPCQQHAVTHILGQCLLSMSCSSHHPVLCIPWEYIPCEKSDDIFIAKALLQMLLEHAYLKIPAGNANLLWGYQRKFKWPAGIFRYACSSNIWSTAFRMEIFYDICHMGCILIGCLALDDGYCMTLTRGTVPGWGLLHVVDKGRPWETCSRNRNTLIVEREPGARPNHVQNAVSQ